MVLSWSGDAASASATASAQQVRMVSSTASRETTGSLSTGASGIATPVWSPRSRARIWRTPSALTLAVLATGGRPSALWRVVRPTWMWTSTACASASSGISRRPRAGSFQSETTRDGGRPAGSDRCTKPNEVRVTTADPGSSARTLAYRAVHRDASCGPSRRVVITRVGPMARSRSATSSMRARSSQMSDTRVTPSSSSTTCTARLGTAMASHHRTPGGSVAARWYCSTWLSSRDQRWCLFWR